MDLSLSLFRFPYQIFARPHRSDATLLHLSSTASVLPVLAYFTVTLLVNILLWNHFLLKYPHPPLYGENLTLISNGEYVLNIVLKEIIFISLLYQYNVSYTPVKYVSSYETVMNDP